MRTTLSLDDDLAKSIENFRKRKNLSLREVVNQLLREGLQATSNEHPSRPLPSWSQDEKALIEHLSLKDFEGPRSMTRGTFAVLFDALFDPFESNRVDITGQVIK